MEYDVNLFSTQPCTTDLQLQSGMNSVIWICRTSSRLVSHRIKKTLVNLANQTVGFSSDSL